MLADRIEGKWIDAFAEVFERCAVKRGDTAASVPVLTRVVAKAPDAAVARYHLGMAQAQAGDNSEARANLTRALNSGIQFSGQAEAKATLEKLAKAPPTAALPKT